MVFKILKQEAQAPEFCDYVKKKIDAAAKKGVVYELEDEDRRIDALYKDANLYTEKRLLSLDRILVNKNEMLVATYEVAFFNSETGKQVDRYIDYEGKRIEPIVTQDPRTNELKVTPVGSLEYDLLFSPTMVDSIISKYGGTEPDEFRFYTASNSPAKKIAPVEVKKKQFFANATWDELLIGKEKKYTSSTTNKLPTLRKEVAIEEHQSETDNKPINNTNTKPFDIESRLKLPPIKDDETFQTNKTDKVTVNTNDTTTTVESKSSENNDVIINKNPSQKKQQNISK